MNTNIKSVNCAIPYSKLAASFDNENCQSFNYSWVDSYLQVWGAR